MCDCVRAFMNVCAGGGGARKKMISMWKVATKLLNVNVFWFSTGIQTVRHEHAYLVRLFKWIVQICYSEHTLR